MNEFDSKNYTILNQIAHSKGPIGAHRVFRSLSEQGFDLSLSTTGRLLKELEEKGLIRKHGKGRAITDKGLKYIARFNLINKSVSYHEKVNNFVSQTEEKQVNDYFDARKVVEKEAARLAVINMSDDDIKDLNDIYNREVQIVVNSDENTGFNELLKDHARLDYDFHTFIIKASQNLYLLNFHEMLGFSRRDQGIYAFMVGIRLQGHGRVVKAIREKDSEAAAAAAELHIEEVRAETIKYMNSKKLMLDFKADQD